jgi:hypothetical protein
VSDVHTGAVRHDAPCDDPWPPSDVLHAIHDRYLVEVVEHLGLCPFARRSREQGRVHRPLWWVPNADGAIDPASAAKVLQSIVVAHPDAEILLPTFVVPADHPWRDAETFAAWVPELRAAYESTGAPRFFMVAFHPGFAGAGTKVSPEALVPRLRRTPDPVIQCVNAEVLERARHAAQVTARERLLQRFAHDPVMSALVARSIQADPELSAEIARNNFAAVGQGAGADELQARIRAIAAARAAAESAPRNAR